MDEIKEYGQTDLNNNRSHKKVHLLSIIGEIEGHENVASGTKATKYEHVLPQLAQVEDDEDTEGLLIILNTVGGDVAVSYTHLDVYKRQHFAFLSLNIYKLRIKVIA